VWRLTCEAFEGLDEEESLHLLSRAMEWIGAENVSAKHYRAMLARRAVDLPGVHARWEHDGLVWMWREAARSHPAAPLPVPGSIRIGGWRITSRPAPAREETDHRDASVATLAAAGPFVVRFPHPGDRIQPLGMSGHKKLSDVFIDRKIPRRERSRIPVVEANGEIVWVVGVAISERARVRGDESVVVRFGATSEGVPA
jgi:tRNA(Ile)-lysidine synthase